MTHKNDPTPEPEVTDPDHPPYFHDPAEAPAPDQPPAHAEPEEDGDDADDPGADNRDTTP
jgi:hypothetical protein